MEGNPPCTSRDPRCSHKEVRIPFIPTVDVPLSIGGHTLRRVPLSGMFPLGAGLFPARRTTRRMAPKIGVDFRASPFPGGRTLCRAPLSGMLPLGAGLFPAL